MGVFAQRLTSLVALLCAMLITLTVHAPQAFATPDNENEGSTPTVRQALDNALRDYNEAKSKLDASVQRKATLADQMKSSQEQLTKLKAEVAPISANAYRNSKVHFGLAVLDSSSTNEILDTATTTQYLNQRNDRKIRELNTAQANYSAQEKQLNEEIKQQEEQTKLLDQKRQAAEAALKKAGGGESASGVTAGQATASPAKRNADGSWPSESCSEKDPTTSGCLTPRTLHAYQEARIAGYTRYTACFRNASSGEHPKGRACDFSPTASGFIDARPTGSDKTYGDKLAGWFLANANLLGVYYVIWWKQIWMPGIGWRTYSGDGTPAGDHYNHVHVSML